jgi:hypothetical protein
LWSSEAAKQTKNFLSFNFSALRRGVRGAFKGRFVNCVHQNQGVLWIDPQTSLPTRLDMSIIVEVTYLGQEPDEFPYNLWINMSEVYQAFNEDFSYPKIK